MTAEDLVEEAKTWDMRSDAGLIVFDVLERIRAFVREQHPEDRAHKSLATDIALFTQRLLDGEAAGDPA